MDLFKISKNFQLKIQVLFKASFLVLPLLAFLNSVKKDGDYCVPGSVASCKLSMISTNSISS